MIDSQALLMIGAKSILQLRRPITAELNVSARRRRSHSYLGGFFVVVVMVTVRLYEPQRWFPVQKVELFLVGRPCLRPCLCVEAELQSFKSQMAAPSRYAGVQPSRVDPVPPVPRSLGHRLVARRAAVRHGLRGHPL